MAQIPSEERPDRPSWLPAAAGAVLLILGVFTLPFGIFLILPGILLTVLGAGIRMKQKRRQKLLSTTKPAMQSYYDPDAAARQTGAGSQSYSRQTFQKTAAYRTDSPDHEHIVPQGNHTLDRELEQLETMRKAGLLDRGEYSQRKRVILARYGQA